MLSNHFPINFKPSIGNELNRILKDRNINYSKIICSLGTIGNNHHHEELIQSVKDWKDGKILIIAGWPNDKMLDKLNRIITQNNLQNKVIILNNINEKLWLEILFKSDLGICFYNKTRLVTNIWLDHLQN